MKACVLESNNKIEYKEIENPNIKPDEVLIKILACGICSSDFNRIYKNGAYFYPIVLGHEFSGKIENCGENIDKNIIGKKGVVFPLLPCYECEFCQQKMYAQCSNYKYFGSRCNGAMSEYISVPIWNVKIIPDDMDCTIAALSEPCAVAVNTVNKILDIKNKRICISGSGTIGIIIGLLAKSYGAKITFILRNERKIEFLKTLGFNNFILNESEEVFDTVIECVGTNNSIKNCIKFVKSKGQIILVGNPADDVILDKKIYWKILRSEIIINGIWNSNYKNNNIDDWDKAIEFLYKNTNLVSKLITHKFKLNDGIKAFDTMQNSKKLCLKGVFVNE